MSPVVFDSRRPVSDKKSRPSLLRGPKVSTATGTKVYLFSSSEYLTCFLAAAISAAPPPAAAVSEMYEAATVSTTVASIVRSVEPLHGIRVCPSGLLPSDLVRPDGSLTSGMPALLRLRCMRSLILLCLACRPNPSEHDNPCVPLEETAVPHAHTCRSQMATPNRRPTATLTASSSSLRSCATSGRACSQSEACGDCEALSLAWL